MTDVHLPWLQAGDAFPDAVWGAETDAPGLVAAGGTLDTATLKRAYSQGIFPWFNDDQPILWWSPQPRMVLQMAEFRLHRSMRQHLQKFLADPACTVRTDTAFGSVIARCARTPRKGQPGTWIVPSMVQAYEQLHRQGLAHSVEVSIGGGPQLRRQLRLQLGDRLLEQLVRFRFLLFSERCLFLFELAVLSFLDSPHLERCVLFDHTCNFCQLNGALFVMPRVLFQILGIVTSRFVIVHRWAAFLLCRVVFSL
jgi:hypothetical protein